MERRLTPILAADVVDYTRLMGDDEARMLAALNQVREELFEPKFAERTGKVIKRMGDGWIVEFANVSDAVACAIDVQEGLKGHEIIRLRVGVHIGDVTFQDDDIYGDGINVAARLEASAEPGQVLISDIVHHSLDNRAGEQFSGGEPQQFKNVTRPVRVWYWPAGVRSDDGVPVAREVEPPPLPKNPSIAVLPFSNMSGDSEQEFLADGICEDIITALSKFHWLFVIARNSTFTYKGTSKAPTEIARQLGVRYVFEGSVRRAGNRVRITVQLVDGGTGSQLWAERYDRELDDIFELQDEITTTLVGQIDTEVRSSELVRAQREPPTSVDAWTLYQQGLFHLYKITEADNQIAISYFDRAIERDQLFCLPYAGLSYCYYLEAMQGYTTTPAESLARAVEAGEQAVRLDEKESFAHFTLGRALALRGQSERAVAVAQRAVQLNPNFAHGQYGLGFVMHWCGRGGEGIAPLLSAIRMSPLDPLMWAIKSVLASCYIGAGQYIDAEAAAREAVNLRPEQLWPHLNLALSLAMQDRMKEARQALEQARTIKPDLSLSALRGMMASLDQEILTEIIAIFDRIGVPE